MVYAVGVQQGSAPLDAVDFVALRKQKLGEVGTVLPGYTCDEGFFHREWGWGRRSAIPFYNLWLAQLQGGRGPGMAASVRIGDSTMRSAFLSGTLESYLNRRFRMF